MNRNYKPNCFCFNPLPVWLHSIQAKTFTLFICQFKHEITCLGNSINQIREKRKEKRE